MLDLRRMTTLPASESHFRSAGIAGGVEARTAAADKPRLIARAAGIFSLLTIVGGIFAQAFVSNRLVSVSDASLTASNILAHRSLFETSLTVYLIEMACQVSSVALFYRLLRVVNPSVALVATFLELTGCVIKTVSRVFYITPLFVLSGARTLASFSPDQLRSVAMLLFRINDRTAGIALAFFGVSGLLKGYLLFRSGFFPRFIGALTIIGSAGWLRFFSPSLAYPPFTLIALIALAVAAVQIFWLIVYGVDEVAWNKAAGRR